MRRENPNFTSSYFKQFCSSPTATLNHEILPDDILRDNASCGLCSIKPFHQESTFKLGPKRPKHMPL